MRSRIYNVILLDFNILPTGWRRWQDNLGFERKNDYGTYWTSSNYGGDGSNINYEYASVVMCYTFRWDSAEIIDGPFSTNFGLPVRLIRD